MSRRLTRFWFIDPDTGKKKSGSRWFDLKTEKDEAFKFLDEHPDYVFEESKYVKE